MEHQHIYDKQGKQICCSLEEKINKKKFLLNFNNSLLLYFYYKTKKFDLEKFVL